MFMRVFITEPILRVNKFFVPFVNRCMRMRDIMNVLNESAGAGEFFELVGEVALDVSSEFLSGNSPYQPWTVVPAARLIRIWKSAAKEGFVRDEAGLTAIADRMIQNTARLYFNTELAEHGTRSKEDVVMSYGLDDEITSENIEAFVDWTIGMPTGGWRISDYGLDPLVKLAIQLIVEDDSDKKLVLIDRMLNVTHQRSDLASWFVEGGTATLDRLKYE